MKNVEKQWQDDLRNDLKWRRCRSCWCGPEHVKVEVVGLKTKCSRSIGKESGQDCSGGRGGWGRRREVEWSLNGQRRCVD